MRSNPDIGRKIYTGGKTTLRSYVYRKVKRIFRSKLANAATPFNWTIDPGVIDARLASIGPIPIKNQFQSFSCGGQAGSYWLGIASAMSAKSTYQEISAKSIYSLIAYPGGGTTDVDLQKQIMNKGAIVESLVPSYTPLGGTTEAWMTDTSWDTPVNAIVALKEAGWIEVTVDNNIDAIASAILNNYATIWHIQGNFYDDENWESATPVPDPTDDEGHFMCQARAFIRNNIKTIGALQSWGEDIGEQGWQFFNNSGYIGSKYLVDIFTFAPKYIPHPTVPGQQIPNPAILTWQQRLVNFFLALFSMGNNS